MNPLVKRTLTAVLFMVFVVALGGQARAADPGDIDFRLMLTRDTRSFHMGEPIGFDLSFTSESNQKYLISQSNVSPAFGPVTIQLAPLEGALDPRALRLCWGGIGGSHLSSGPQYLNSKSITEHGELTEWYRFQKPGHYTMSVTSRGVSRPRSRDDGGGVEFLTLESNPIEFDILPPDSVWEADEMQAIALKLADAKYPGDLISAADRLSLLDTPDSARKLVEIYLSTSAPGKYTFASVLTQTFQLDVVIPLLEAALSDPEVNPSGIPEVLAQLRVRKQVGVLAPPTPDDSDAQKQWQASCQAQRKLYDEFLTGDEALLLSHAALHSGPKQSAAIYKAWNLAENESAQGGPSAESLGQLRLAVVNVAKELDPDQQNQILLSEWKILPHEELKPLIISLAPTYRLDAYKFWCEDWPGECSNAILPDALKPDTQFTPPHILMVAERAHPEMDSGLRGQLANPSMLQPNAQSNRAAALVLRVGSRELLPDVDEVLKQSAAKHGYNCEVEGYLLGYLFRVAVEDGQRHLSEMLQDEKCGDQLFRILSTARYSDALLPVAARALNSHNLAAAGTAAIFLGEHGPAAEEDALWERLNSLWLAWHDRTGELQTTFTPFDHGIPSQNARLEQSLASALVHASNWSLTPSEVNRLRDGCITTQCKDIADSKLWLGL
jgi:hypothetical protein